MMLIQNGICQYEGKYAALNKNICQFLGPSPNAISGKSQSASPCCITGSINNHHHEAKTVTSRKKLRIRIITCKYYFGTHQFSNLAFSK